MSDEKYLPREFDTIDKATSTTASNMKSRRLIQTQMIQNIHLVWLDENINDGNNENDHNSITKLQQVVKNVKTFINADECVDFITDMTNQTVYVIVSDDFSHIINPIVQDISQVASVYIFCQNQTQNGKQPEHGMKMKGVFIDITLICEALEKAIQQYDHNSISISFFKTNDTSVNQNLDQLDSSFMYTEILKEILLTIDFKQNHIDEFLTYCRAQFTESTTNLNHINKIEREYIQHQPIWWYTSDTFLYSMINSALRLMEVDLIVKTGFFLRDLHNNIAKLHEEQYGKQDPSKLFIVYRGQGLSEADFNQLKNMHDGLISFNNFLSTSMDRVVPLAYAESNQGNPDLIGILFKMNIDPSISATPFANIKNISYFEEEEEILFSMHSVFRLGQVQQLDDKARLWEVELTLTSDNDPQLKVLTERMRKDTFQGFEGWGRLGMLMIILAQYDKAEKVYKMLLEQTTCQSLKGYLLNQLGCIKIHQDNYIDAGRFYEESIQLRHKTLPADHPDLAISYNNIGLVYGHMRRYSKALEYHEKALEIRQKSLPTNHPEFSQSYSNIGGIYVNMGNYPEALEYYQKALKIYQETLPAYHPQLAQSYNNIGGVYNKIGNHSATLDYFEKALEIDKKVLPANHPDLANIFDNIGSVYSDMGKYSKGLEYYSKALEIRQKTLPAYHSLLATSYHNIKGMHGMMGNYSKALEYYEKAFEIDKKNFPVDDPHLATSYNNIGGLYKMVGEHSKALEYYEKTREILQKTLPANHPQLAQSYNNIAMVHYTKGQYSEALSYLQQALDIFERSLPSEHRYIQNVKQGIAMIEKKL